jgi:hypothetical protein
MCLRVWPAESMQEVPCELCGSPVVRLYMLHHLLSHHAGHGYILVHNPNTRNGLSVWSCWCAEGNGYEWLQDRQMEAHLAEHGGPLTHLAELLLR